MSKKTREYEKVQQEEWIEMDDLNQPRNQDKSKKFAQLEGKQFAGPKRSIIPEYEEEQLGPRGGSNRADRNEPFRHVENVALERQKYRQKIPPSLPMMQATCDFCTVVQQVPGNTQVFICGSCQNMNECYPLYGLFSCGNCQANVGFGFGVSESVKCPKCSSINRVPLEPVKKYESMEGTMPQPPPSTRPASQPIHPEIKPEYPNFPSQEYNMIKKEGGAWGEKREIERGSKKGFQEQEEFYVGIQRQEREDLGD